MVFDVVKVGFYHGSNDVCSNTILQAAVPGPTGINACIWSVIIFVVISS